MSPLAGGLIREDQMFYATERAAHQVAYRLNRNLSEQERSRGRYIVRNPNPGAWEVCWQVY